MNKKRVFLFISLTAAVAIIGIRADETNLALFRQMLARSNFPENGESRRFLQHLVMSPSYPSDETSFRVLRQRSDGRIVQFELREMILEWYLIFRNQRGNDMDGEYPLWGRGTWIIKKSMLTGEFIQAKVFLQDDEESFVRIFPKDENRSRLDVHLYGQQLGDDVIIPSSFNELVLSSFAEIISSTDRLIDWNLIFPDPRRHGYRRVETLVKKIQPYTDRIVEFDDAAIDGGGRNVLIETGEALPVNAVPSGRTGLNCAGFVKWVADGMYSAWAGKPGQEYLDIDPLRKSAQSGNWNSWSESRSAAGQEIRENNSFIRDPLFGLDWNRNLAQRIESARIRRDLDSDEKDVLNTGNLFGIPHKKDIGYELGNLVPALYQLASIHPGSIYLAAINSRFVPDVGEGDPIALHQYWHVMMLAPWFDDGRGGGEAGSFHVAVLDTGDIAETLIREPGTDFQPRFLEFILDKAAQHGKMGRDDSGNVVVPEVMVHLVRAEIPPDFQPLPLPEAY